MSAKYCAKASAAFRSLQQRWGERKQLLLVQKKGGVVNGRFHHIGQLFIVYFKCSSVALSPEFASSHVFQPSHRLKLAKSALVRGVLLF